MRTSDWSSDVCSSDLHGLDRLAEHLPVLVEVLAHLPCVGFELADALERRLIGDQRMRRTDAEIAQHRRVGECALPARDRQLPGEMLEEGIGNAEIALGILEIDRVYRSDDRGGWQEGVSTCRSRWSPLH